MDIRWVSDSRFVIDSIATSDVASRAVWWKAACKALCVSELWFDITGMFAYDDADHLGETRNSVANPRD